MAASRAGFAMGHNAAVNRDPFLFSPSGRPGDMLCMSPRVEHVWNKGR